MGGIIEFTNLDQPEELKAAKKALNGAAGVYAIINNITGTVYIGSSMNPRAPGQIKKTRFFSKIKSYPTSGGGRVVFI